jgi:hypothetical protein
LKLADTRREVREVMPVDRADCPHEFCESWTKKQPERQKGQKFNPAACPAGRVRRTR